MFRYFIIAILLLISGCSSDPQIIDYPGKLLGNGQHKVQIVSHGWHTGFVIDASEIQKQIPQLKQRFEGARHIEFGWGDKGFYQAQEITSGLTVKAIFWPTESVIHSVAVPSNVDDYFNNSKVEFICLNDSEYLSLINFISSSFYRDNTGNVVSLENGIYGDSQFYKGVGDYYLMNTCNKWTAKGLKSMGMDICPTFKLTSDSIMNYVESFNKHLKKPNNSLSTRTQSCS